MKLSTLNLSDDTKSDDTKGSVVAEHIPKHHGKRTHEGELNAREYKNFDRNGLQGVFHTDHAMSDVTIILRLHCQPVCHVSSINTSRILGKKDGG